MKLPNCDICGKEVHIPNVVKNEYGKWECDNCFYRNVEANLFLNKILDEQIRNFNP